IHEANTYKRRRVERGNGFIVPTGSHRLSNSSGHCDYLLSIVAADSTLVNTLQHSSTLVNTRQHERVTSNLQPRCDSHLPFNGRFSQHQESSTQIEWPIQHPVMFDLLF